MIEVGVRTLVANSYGALARRFQPDHQIEECGLTTAGLPDDCHHFAWCNVEIETVDRDDGLSGSCLTEDLAQAAHFDRRWATHARHRNRRASARATTASSKNKSATNTSVQAKTSATENSSCATDNWCPMPVTAPTSSAMVTTRIARLMLTFQLVKMVGTIAGSINLKKYCQVVGRNDCIIWRNSRGTPRMASSVSTRKTGPHTTTSTKQMRNSTPGNHSTANRIHDTTGTAISRRIIGCRYLSSESERYIAIASARPRTNEMKRAAITRASVTAISIGVMVATLRAMRTKLGIAKGGIPR